MKSKCLEEKNRAGILLPVALVAAIALCMGCNGEGQATDGSSQESAAEALGTTAQSEEEVQQEPADGAEAAGTEEAGVTGVDDTEAVEPEVEEVDELTALYNNYKDLGANDPSVVQDFTHALREIGYDEICLASLETRYYRFNMRDGGQEEVSAEDSGASVAPTHTLNYFSVEDGNHFILPELGDVNARLYVPYTPIEFSCDNEDICMLYSLHYDIEYDNDSDTTSYKEIDLYFNGKEFIDFSADYGSTPQQEDSGDNRLWLEACESNILVVFDEFEGDDIPVNFSVTFEDGSTQETTIYITRHAE